MEDVMRQLTPEQQKTFQEALAKIEATYDQPSKMWEDFDQVAGSLLGPAAALFDPAQDRKAIT